MIKIYHNPRCAKSREGLALLEASEQLYETVLYLDGALNAKELKDILRKLNYTPVELIRKNEAVWKEHFKGKTLSDNEIIAAMIKYPKLIERPIVVTENEAVVGRPPEKIKELLWCFTADQQHFTAYYLCQFNIHLTFNDKPSSIFEIQ